MPQQIRFSDIFHVVFFNAFIIILEAVGQPTFGTVEPLRKSSDLSSTMNEDIHCPMCDLAGFKSQTEFDLHFLTHEAEFTEIGKVHPHQRTHRYQRCGN